ncbi:MAG: Error-prone repair protein ImuA [Daejeonella sp.]|uniref:ImuA family protein n=1 Tax=Daejeonella sp. TaxID=2805397 RepID=UPI003C72F22E
MSVLETKKDLINKLQKSILLMQGYTPPVSDAADSFGLGPIEEAFPNSVFPTGAIHEFLSIGPEQSAANGGFIGGLLNHLMQNGGACLWISMRRTLFPPSLKIFGVEPDQMIFIDLKRERDVLWAMEEALKCKGLAAVIGEVEEISFTHTRRLQLAAEQSRVTGFVLRSDPKKLSATACVARWNITQLPSELENGMPGVGFPRWNVELLKVRNGNPGTWKVEWSGGRFKSLAEQTEVIVSSQSLKAG